MNVSRWVDIRNARAHCLTPSELRERASQRSSRNRKFRRIWSNPWPDAYIFVHNVHISDFGLCVLWIFFHIDFLVRFKIPARYNNNNNFAVAKNVKIIEKNSFWQKNHQIRFLIREEIEEIIENVVWERWTLFPLYFQSIPGSKIQFFHSKKYVLTKIRIFRYRKYI